MTEPIRKLKIRGAEDAVAVPKTTQAPISAPARVLVVPSYTTLDLDYARIEIAFAVLKRRSTETGKALQPTLFDRSCGQSYLRTTATQLPENVRWGHVRALCAEHFHMLVLVPANETWSTLGRGQFEFYQEFKRAGRVIRVVTETGKLASLGEVSEDPRGNWKIAYAWIIAIDER